MLERHGEERSGDGQHDQREPVADKPNLPGDHDAFFKQRGFVPTRHDERRRFPRIYFRRQTVAHPLQNLPAFRHEQAELTVYVNDISRMGVSLISGIQLFPAEVLEIDLPDIGRKRVEIKRCRRLTADCFDVGAKFFNC